MRISDIFSLLKEYTMLGILLVIFIGVLFLIGYKLIYKKIMKGTKIISRKKLILYSISICYMSIVFGAVFLSRSGLYGNANLHLFSSYREAFNKMEISLFRNIILNILLFVPFGFLLPIYSDKLKKSYIVVLAGTVLSLIIESIQYKARIGIFELDDIFNNMLGTLIGYCVYRIYYNLKNKIYRKYILLYTLPIFIITFSAIGIYYKYENQELGNLASEYIYRINMKNINLQNNAILTKEVKQKSIFYKKILDIQETRDIANEIFSKNDVDIDDDRTDIYEDTIIYYSNKKGENTYSLWIDYKGGTYSYTDFSKFSSNNNQKMEKIKGASRQEIESSLKKFNIEIPKNAVFQEKSNGDYSFTLNMELEEKELVNGTLVCSYYEDKTIKDIKNDIVKYDKVNEKEIISEEEAYNKILEGKFQYDEYYLGKINDMIIQDVNIRYSLDTKGYYVPIYVFDSKINGRNAKIEIKAVK